MTRLKPISATVCEPMLLPDAETNVQLAMNEAVLRRLMYVAGIMPKPSQ